MLLPRGQLAAWRPGTIVGQGAGLKLPLGRATAPHRTRARADAFSDELVLLQICKD